MCSPQFQPDVLLRLKFIRVTISVCTSFHPEADLRLMNYDHKCVSCWRGRGRWARWRERKRRARWPRSATMRRLEINIPQSQFAHLNKVKYILIFTTGLGICSLWSCIFKLPLSVPYTSAVLNCQYICNWIPNTAAVGCFTYEKTNFGWRGGRGLKFFYFWMQCSRNQGDQTDEQLSCALTEVRLSGAVIINFFNEIATGKGTWPNGMEPVFVLFINQKKSSEWIILMGLKASFTQRQPLTLLGLFLRIQLGNWLCLKAILGNLEVWNAEPLPTEKVLEEPSTCWKRCGWRTLGSLFNQRRHTGRNRGCIQSRSWKSRRSTSESLGWSILWISSTINCNTFVGTPLLFSLHFPLTHTSP